MGTYLAFTLYSGTFLLAFYFIYILLAAREKQFKLNRILLLSIYILSLASWPISKISINHLPSDTEIIQKSSVEQMEKSDPANESFPTFMSILAGIYLTGMISTLGLTLLNLLRTIKTLRRGYRIPEKGYYLLVLQIDNIVPFSFFKYIVIGAADISQDRRYVIEHELAHIREYHFLDLLLAQTVCILLWYNPAAWGMRKELALVHEFQADAKVLSEGADRKEYQLLLIRAASGSSFHIFANNLRHNDLRLRIIMMHKENCKGLRRLLPISLIVAPIIAFSVLNTSFVSAEFKNLQSFKVLPSKNNDVGSDLRFVDYYGNPITTIAYVSFSDSDTISEEETIKLPLTSEEMKGLMFFVNGSLLSKDKQPIIFVNGKRWTHSIDEIDTDNIETCSYKEDDKGNPYGVADITLKQ